MKRLSNTRLIECASLQIISYRAQCIELCIFWGGGAVLFVWTQLGSFRFSIQGILTTDSSPTANPLDASYKFGELLPKQLGQIPYTETEKGSKVWRSMRLIKHDIGDIIHRALHGRVETRKFLLECWKYFSSERSEPTTALKHVFLAFTGPTKICYVTMVTLNFFTREEDWKFSHKSLLGKVFRWCFYNNYISFLFDSCFRESVFH